MTLIRSNPQYKRKRARYIWENYNPARKCLEEVENTIRTVDLLSNSINEKLGRQIQAEELYLWVIGLLTGSDSVCMEVDPAVLYDEMENIVLDFPPRIYSDITVPTLLKLKESVPNVTFSLLSNTAFIKGKTLRKVLPNLGLDGLFAFELYSDEVGMSKPNKGIFEAMLLMLQNLRGQIPNDSVVHVGDNPVADMAGAESAGICSILINSNQQKIDNLLLTA